jgi:ABC-type phosphate transport system substrate-binding protein
MPTIFISYRREDSAYITGRIYESIAARFGKDHVFMDLASLRGGDDYPARLEDLVRSSTIVLVVIGQQWLTLTQQRQHDVHDLARLEIEVALTRRAVVIPLLVQSATMPSESDLPASLAQLPYRNAISIRPDPDFSRDLDRAITEIDSRTRTKRRPVVPWVAAGLSGLSSVILIAMILSLLATGTLWPWGATAHPQSSPTSTLVPTDALLNPACTVSAADFQVPGGPLSEPPKVTGISGQEVTASGSSNVVRLLQAAQQSFDHANGTVTHFSTTGSGEGILDLSNQQVQIAATSFSYTEENATKNLFNLQGVTVAAVPSTLLVGRGLKDKVNNLTIRQVIDIYQGKYTNWRQLGGPDLPIVAIARGDQTTGDTISGTMTTFRNYVLGGASVNRSFVKSYAGTNEIIDALSTTFPDAIAFAATSVFLDTSTWTKVVPICIDGASAMLNNINKGAYPFWNLAHIYTWGKIDTATAKGKAIQAWIEYLTSADFQNKNVPQAGLYPLSLLTASALQQRPAA